VNYRDRAQLISKSNGYESYAYHNSEYRVFNDNEVPVDMQHYFEQNAIDFLSDNKSRVLVIHPDDRSTDFLRLVYEGRGYDVITFKGNTIYNNDVCREIAKEQIECHDKIIMLGHGTPDGLLNPRTGRYIIDEEFIDLLRERETISIWCYSDRFFRNNNVFNNQFHTGMIISECLEQLMMLGKVYLDREAQLENMERFAEIVGECIEDTPEVMRRHVLENYVGDDPVTKFNRNNILVF